MIGSRSLTPVKGKVTLLSQQAQRTQRETAGTVRDYSSDFPVNPWANPSRLNLCGICSAGSLWIQEIQGNKIFGSQRQAKSALDWFVIMTENQDSPENMEEECRIDYIATNVFQC